jgi:hypothetical protein
MRPALDPAGHRVPRTKPTCLLHTWRPHRQRSFALVLHLHQHQSSRNLHLQYLAKNQSTQRCQSLITQGSDHPQLTRRTSQETTLHPRRLRKISTKHLTLGNDHTDKVPSRVQNPRTTWLKQHLKALIQQLGRRKKIVPQRLNKSNTPQSDLVTHFDLTF